MRRRFAAVVLLLASLTGCATAPGPEAARLRTDASELLRRMASLLNDYTLESQAAVSRSLDIQIGPDFSSGPAGTHFAVSGWLAPSSNADRAYFVHVPTARLGNEIMASLDLSLEAAPCITWDRLLETFFTSARGGGSLWVTRDFWDRGTAHSPSRIDVVVRAAVTRGWIDFRFPDGLDHCANAARVFRQSRGPMIAPAV